MKIYFDLRLSNSKFSLENKSAGEKVRCFRTCVCPKIKSNLNIVFWLIFAEPEICINFGESVFSASIYKCGFTLEQYQQKPPFVYPMPNWCPRPPLIVPNILSFALCQMIPQSLLIPFRLAIFSFIISLRRIFTNNSCLHNFFFGSISAGRCLFRVLFEKSYFLLQLARTWHSMICSCVFQLVAMKKLTKQSSNFCVFIFGRKFGLWGNLWAFV